MHVIQTIPGCQPTKRLKNLYYSPAVSVIHNTPSCKPQNNHEPGSLSALALSQLGTKLGRNNSFDDQIMCITSCHCHVIFNARYLILTFDGHFKHSSPAALIAPTHTFCIIINRSMRRRLSLIIYDVESNGRDYIPRRCSTVDTCIRSLHLFNGTCSIWVGAKSRRTRSLLLIFNIQWCAGEAEALCKSVLLAKCGIYCQGSWKRILIFIIRHSNARLAALNDVFLECFVIFVNLSFLSIIFRLRDWNMCSLIFHWVILGDIL